MTEVEVAQYIAKLEDEIRAYQVRMDNDAQRISVQEQMIARMDTIIRDTVSQWVKAAEELVELDKRRKQS